MQGLSPVAAPIVRSIFTGGENETPPAIFSRLSSPFLLEGSEGGWFNGQYSLIGLSPFAVFQSKGQETLFTVTLDGTATPPVRQSGDPLARLQTYLDRFKPDSQNDSGLPQSFPLLHGGAVGFISYDLIQQYEPVPPHPGESGLPDIYMVFINHFILFDHAARRYDIVYNPDSLIALGLDPSEAERRGRAAIESVLQQIEAPPQEVGCLISAPLEITPMLSEKDYIAQVERAQRYISAGDIFQANLSHSFHAPFYGQSLFPVYQRMCRINPSPFAAYFKMGGMEMAGASPERLMRITKRSEGAILETRPIAGTRPRGRTVAEDDHQTAALYDSAKERAEHLMLVDLERNDIGKVCRFGSVKVEALLALERYSHVFHLVSNIVGTLRDSVCTTDALRSLFPGGTITGVPKIRCMQIIAELEKCPRGVYTGSAGYIAFSGESDMNIVIRSIIRQENKLSFHVGAGIVADADPAMEYQETLHKAAALFNALEPFSLCGSISKTDLS